MLIINSGSNFQGSPQKPEKWNENEIYENYLKNLSLKFKPYAKRRKTTDSIHLVYEHVLNQHCEIRPLRFCKCFIYSFLLSMNNEEKTWKIKKKKRYSSVDRLFRSSLQRLSFLLSTSRSEPMINSRKSCIVHSNEANPHWHTADCDGSGVAILGIWGRCRC